MIFRADKDFASYTRSFDECRYRHWRLFDEGLVPAGQDLAHYQSTLSTKRWMIPPQVRPTPKASSSEIPYVRSLGVPLSITAIASSKTAGSTHPPLTDPTTCPSSETAIEVPGPNGPDRSTFTTVASAAFLSSSRHRATLSTTGFIHTSFCALLYSSSHF